MSTSRNQRKSPAISPRKAPRQARAQATVDAILEATARVLVARGYAGSTTNLIAETAGVSVGSLYQYFPNKDALVAALHERHMDAVVAIIRRELERRQPVSLADTVRAVIAGVIEAHRLDAPLHRVLETEVPEIDRRAGANGVEERILGAIERLLRSHRHHIVPQDVPLAAFVVLRVVDSLVHAAVIDPLGARKAETITAEITPVVLRYLGVPEAPAPRAG
jgi:AcrR family transcriptional regulator